MKEYKIAIITTHPIQYNAPLFELLNKKDNISVKVFYTWGISVINEKHDPGFCKNIQWDIPLLNGYEYEFLENVSQDKGSHHFKGIDNPTIIQSIKNYDPDVILVYGWSFKSHLKVLRFFKNKTPIWFRGDSTLLDKGGFLSPIMRSIFLRWIYRHIDIAFYVGKNNFDYYKKAGLKKSQLIYAPHAVDNKRFASNNEGCITDALVLRRELNIGKDDFVFLFAGKLEIKKNPKILLQAFIESNFNNNVQLIIVGNGEQENELKKIYKSRKNIHFLDFQNQMKMPSIYESSDVFVLPSSGPGETWGLAVNEALANGKPVIISDKCGCAVDLVDNGLNGFIFQAGNKEDLILRLQYMVEHKNEIGKMKDHSLQKIKKFTLSTIVNTIEMKLSTIKKQ